jgi:hypothetical protein
MQFTKRLPLLVMMVFLLSVLTVEPEYTQGYENDTFPVFVESDAVFAICSNEFAITAPCLVFVEEIPLPLSSRPVASPVISCQSSRGPPAISLIS